MVRKVGQVLLAAALFAAGCRDLTMDLLPAPPRGAAGAGDESAGGMAGDTPMGDGADSGKGGTRPSGGVGGNGPGSGGNGYGATGACGPNTYLGGFGCPCMSDQSCREAYTVPYALPYCRFTHCVQCLADDECPPGGNCGCQANEVCADFKNACVPRCETDLQCTTKEKPYCDSARNSCSQCVDDQDCDNGSSDAKQCNEFTGECVQCTENDDCGEDKPICNLGSFQCQKCVEPQCGEGKQCRDGRCITRSSPPPPPEP